MKGKKIPEKSVVEEDAKEIEEGEVVKGWSHVSPGKASKSPKMKSREYGQVKIVTRFSALVDVDVNSDLVDQEEGKGNEVIKTGKKKRS